MNKHISSSFDTPNWFWYTYPNTPMPRRMIRTDRPW